MAATTRVALVTGAGQRVGRAIAAALAEDGWAIAAHYRQSREGAEELVASIRAQGGEAEASARTSAIPPPANSS